MLCAYVAGKMTDSNPVEFLRNLNALQEWTAKVRDFGMAPFPVADDFADIMRTKETTIPQIKEASMEWLRRADVVFATPGYESSPGTVEEIRVARELGIPVVFDLVELGHLKSNHDQKQCELPEGGAE